MVEPPAAEPTPASPAARIIDELLAGGEAVDDGAFTLDPVAAAAKLEAFAYADRSLYLIPIVEGLIGLGAREIVLDTRREDLLIAGRGISLEQVDRWFLDLYSYAIGSGADARGRAFGRLAIGLDMTLGDATERVRLCYSGPSEAVIGEYRFRQTPKISRAPADVINELSIFIDNPWLRGPSQALAHLRAAVRFSNYVFHLDGELISRQRRYWHDIQSGEGPGYGFIAGFEPTGEQRSACELWTAGVCVETIHGDGKAFRAAIDLDAPRRDLGQIKIVRDATVGQALVAVEQARVEGLRRLEHADASWTDATRPAAWPRDRVDRVLGRPVRAPAAPVVPRLVARTPVSTDQLLARGAIQSEAAQGSLALGIVLLVMGGGLWIACLLELTTGGIAWPFFAAAALLVPAGLVSLVPMRRELRRVIRTRDYGIRTTAKIVGIQQLPASPHTSGPGGRVLWSFIDRNGVQRTGGSLHRVLEEASRWQIGEEIAIYYDPERPEESWWEADVGPRKVS